MVSMRGFGSDNNSGVLPEIWEALNRVNQGHFPSYGDDEVSRKVENLFKDHFGPEVSTYLVFNGTAANVLSLMSGLKRYESVIASDSSHLHLDECGAPEKLLGSKLLLIPNQKGKLTVSEIEKHMVRLGDQHHVQPRMISITQPTELGTVYTLDEIRRISEFARRHQLFLHMDGARLANAVVSLDCDFKEMTLRSGVDILSLGGTKNGLMFGEAVVILNPALQEGFKYLRKQNLQLASKMRFISAQFQCYLEGDLWRRTAEHSLKMAARLKAGAQKISGVQVLYPVESNAVFASLPRHIIAPLRKKYFFYVWDERTFSVRWMTTFDTTESDVDGLLSELKHLTEDLF